MIEQIHLIVSATETKWDIEIETTLIGTRQVGGAELNQERVECEQISEIQGIWRADASTETMQNRRLWAMQR